MPLVDLAAVRRRYVLLTALTWLPVGLTLAVGVLLMSARGLGVAEIGLVFIVHSVVVTALELPTGGLSDVIGRRGVLVVSAVTGLAALAWIAVASTVWEFVAIAAMRGVARALSSGPAEAWFVDASHALDRDAPVRGGLAAGEATVSIVLAAGTVLGGLMPMLLPDGDLGPFTSLSIPMIAAAIGYLVLALTALWGMPEPERDGPRPGVAALAREVPSVVASGVRLALRRRVLVHLLVTIAAVGAVLNSIELFTPIRVEELTGGPGRAATVYGVVTAAGFLGGALGAAASGRLVLALRGPVAAVAAGLVTSALGVGVLVASTALDSVGGLVVTGVGYVVTFAGIGAAGPVRSEIVHHEVTARERATVVSVQSLVLQAGGVLAALGLPWLDRLVGVGGVWAVTASLLLAGAALSLRIRSDVAASHRGREAVDV